MAQTKEELQKQIADAQKLLEEMPDPEDEVEEEDTTETDDTAEDQEEKDTTETETEEVEEETTEEEDDSEEQDEEETETEEDTEAEEEDQEEKDTTEKKGEQDYEEKFRQSSSEAQRIATSKKQLEEDIDAAYELPEPTDDELKSALQKDGINYDELSDFEKKMAKENLHNKVINNRIRDIRLSHRESENKIKDFVKKVDAYSIQPNTLKKYPLLEGKQEELKKFAARPERITLSLDDLVALFLVKTAKTTKHKGKMFETGSRGGEDRGKKETGMITLAEANKLMRTNFPEYRRLLKAKKIDFNSA